MIISLYFILFIYMDKDQKVPVVIGSQKMGNNWMVHMCEAPQGGGFFMLLVHSSKLSEVKIDPKTKELDIPAKYVYQKKNPPQEFFCPMFGVIGMYEEK